MSNVLDGSLYKKQDKQFEKINDLSKHFAGYIAAQQFSGLLSLKSFQTMQERMRLNWKS